MSGPTQTKLNAALIAMKAIEAAKVASYAPVPARLARLKEIEQTLREDIELAIEAEQEARR